MEMLVTVSSTGAFRSFRKITKCAENTTPQRLRDASRVHETNDRTLTRRVSWDRQNKVQCSDEEKDRKTPYAKAMLRMEQFDINRAALLVDAVISAWSPPVASIGDACRTKSLSMKALS